MDSTKKISKKIALLGNHAVGKTSLISRFVFQMFPESYLTTIGLKVDKKSVSIKDYELELIIWDIAGQETFLQVPQYYLKGCNGIIYVVDLSRPKTYESLAEHLSTLRSIVNTADIILAANKKDLYENTNELEAILDQFEIKPDITTSAKTGESVEEMFRLLAEKLILHHESQGA